MTTTDRTTEPADVFDAHLAHWEAAEADPDGTVERVARALAIDLAESQRHPQPERYFEMYADLYRKYARAAIDALRPAPDAPRVDDDGCDWNQGYAAAMADMQLEALETGR
jgi:hypothetical protein